MTDPSDQQSYFDEVSEEYDQYYDRPETVMDFEKVRRLETALSLTSVDTTDAVATVGVGSGELLQAVGELETEPVGVDFSGSMLRLARDRVDGEYVQGAVQRLPLRTGSVDALYCLGVLGYLDDSDLEAAISELARVVAPGGRLVVSFASARSPFRRFRQFYYYRLLEAAKRVTGLGEPASHHYSAHSPARVFEALSGAGLVVADERYLTYSTGIFDRKPNRWLYRLLDRRFDDSDLVGPLAMTRVVAAAKPTR